MKRLFQSDSGQAIAEAAVLIPVFVFVAFALIDIQWMTRTAAAIEYVVTEAARCEAIQSQACTAPQSTQGYAAQLAANMRLNANLQIATPPCSQGGVQRFDHVPIRGAGCMVSKDHDQPHRYRFDSATSGDRPMRDGDEFEVVRKGKFVDYLKPKNARGGVVHIASNLVGSVLVADYEEYFALATRGGSYNAQEAILETIAYILLDKLRTKPEVRE